MRKKTKKSRSRKTAMPAEAQPSREAKGERANFGASYPARAEKSNIPRPSITPSKPAVPERAAETEGSSEKPLHVPQILLEDDTSLFTALGKKLGSSPTSPAAQGHGQKQELPEAYGTGKLLLTARDPHWLYAHWDLTRKEQREQNARSIHGHLVVRVHVESVRAGPETEIHVHPESQHWFIHVERAGTPYTAELGYYRAPGKWVNVAKSRPAMTPPETVAVDRSVELVTIDPNVHLSQIGAGGKDLAIGAAAQSSRAQESSLAEIFSSIEAGPAQRGSAELPELLSGQPGQEALRPGAPVLGVESFEAGVGGISSPRGGEAGEQRRGFWLNVNAELVIYGGTEPGASVTVDGQPIRLRPDGTFSCRFALPDGRYEVIIGAMSEAGDVRQVLLNFTRRTERQGDVGIQPGEELGEMQKE